MKINNRRYLGNKYKLLPFIKEVVDEHCPDVDSVADIFAGTGAVASAFTDKRIVTNDILYSNYIANLAWFGSQIYDHDKIAQLIGEYNEVEALDDNYMSANFSDTFFSRQDCMKIGYIRQDIENLYNNGEINERERALLITSLLYAMDKIANTCGHYDAYRKGVPFEKHIELQMPEPDNNMNPENVCYNMDANELVSSLDVDLLYIDPPYNSRQYCDAYHLLENVARWEQPEVTGDARKMDRSGLKSDYCMKKAPEAFEDLIQKSHAKYILLSYNNMATKGNERSNAKISDDDIMRILSRKGKVEVFCEDYKAFTTGKTDFHDNQERLFLCTCAEPNKKIIASALNYTGGKYKLLSQILPLFPKDMDNVVDLFCGGCNVGLNVDCDRVIFNDADGHLIGLYQTLKTMDKRDIFEWLYSHIASYGLSMVCQRGYDFYHCDSSKGLGQYNRAGFLKLRDDFNAKREQDSDYFLMLYLLIVYSFNNQIRFNSEGEFNLPVGKRDFNNKMQEKLSDFIDRIKTGGYEFTNIDFRELTADKLTDKTFVYADPPYLITCATYNEKNGWTAEDERDLLEYLEDLDRNGIKFALSNVLESKGKQNNILYNWVECHDKFRAIPIDYSYSNSNYHTRRDGVTTEVLVVNY